MFFDIEPLRLTEHKAGALKSVLRVVLAYPLALLRFGSDLMVSISRYFGTKIVFIEDIKHSFEHALASDAIEIITVFSAKLYGARSHQKKKALLMAA